MAAVLETIVDTDGSQVYIIRNWLQPDLCTELLRRMSAEFPWIQGMTFGQPIPRLMAFLGDQSINTYQYNNKVFKLESWNVPDEHMYSVVRKLRDCIRTDPTLASLGLQLDYNSCLMNFYRDGHDSIQMHSDKEALGPKNAVAAISFGATRTFILKNQVKGPNGRYPTIKTPINNGDLMIMAGECQKHWVHGINKEPGVTEPRISLTFRQIRN